MVHIFSTCSLFRIVSAVLSAFLYVL